MWTRARRLAYHSPRPSGGEFHAVRVGGFDEACEPRHLPWRRAHDIVNYLSLNFFDAVLRDDAAALGRLDPGVVAGIEDLRYWRK